LGEILQILSIVLFEEVSITQVLTYEKSFAKRTFSVSQPIIITGLMTGQQCFNIKRTQGDFAVKLKNQKSEFFLKKYLTYPLSRCTISVE